MNFKMDNWKLLLVSVFYVILTVVSFQISLSQLETFFMVAGVIIVVVGILQICAYFFKKDYLKPNEFSFSFGVIYLLVGMFVAIRPQDIVNNYPFVVSLVVVADSALRLQYAMNLLRLENPRWSLYLILGIVPLVVAMLLIMVKMEIESVLVIFRILLILDAIANVMTVIYYDAVMKRANHQKNEIVESNIVE